LFKYVRERLPKPSDKEALEALAKASGVNYHTLLKLANGATEDPRVSTVETLLRYFREREAA